uniref:Uncharacterized protein n=1 Tax=Rhizophora mucronata TaxID=61149 RepID=A0A2P2NYN5_RHIMU
MCNIFSFRHSNVGITIQCAIPSSFWFFRRELGLKIFASS